MNRFAFRAWDTEERRMRSWNEILGVTVRTYKLGKMTVGELFRSGRYLVMQWTGEQDENGRNIYEEDIIQHRTVNKEELYRVFYDPGSAGYETEAEQPTMFNMRPAMNPGTTKYMKIVGNTYETCFRANDETEIEEWKKYETARAAMIRLAFRAWDVHAKRMIAWKQLFELTVYELFRSGRYEIMQWTGAMDQNRNFIFEGDIIKKSKEGNSYIAYWAGGIGFWTWAIVPKDYGRPSLAPDKRKGRIFVIGNTHENPEEAKYNTLEAIYKESGAKPWMPF